MAKKKKPKEPVMKRCRLVVEVEYDSNITDPESLATALDNLMDVATSTPGILEEYGDPTIFEFLMEGVHDEYDKTLAGPGPDPTKSLRSSSANPNFSNTSKLQVTGTETFRSQSKIPNMKAMPEEDRGTKVLAVGHMTDDANLKVPSLPFKVTQESYGISVAAFDDTGHQLGEVLLDYHGNQLACLCYHPDHDDVVDKYVFTKDVKKSRKGKKKKE